jgi:flavin reductase (DIM6/NTAB) family NADH-FMN oxidoreductase RutF
MTASERTHVDAASFRTALRHLAGGVTVVTAAGPDGPVGLTVTSLTAASLVPPLVSFYVDRDSGSLPALRAATHFGVHLLGGGQSELAALFARRGIDRFAPPTRWQAGPGGVPILTDVPVHLVCTLERTLPVGDHVLFVGAVHRTGVVEAGGDPLAYAHGQFGVFVPVSATAAELEVSAW